MSTQPGDIDAADIDYSTWKPTPGYQADTTDDTPDEADVFDLNAEDDDAE
jgi:hypothetical protein